jgi:vacuolar-type H+-ATPase subunit I/STV1
MRTELVNKAFRAPLRMAVLVCCSLAWNSASLAETPKGGGDAAVLQTLRKAQGLLRQLSQEKADLEAKNAALEEQIKALKAVEARVRQLEPLENEVRQHKASLEEMRAGNAALQQRISGDAEHLRAFAERQRKTAGELEKYRRDNVLLVNAVTERTRWIEECAGKNKSLVQANREWIERHGNQDFWETLKAAEPLTGIGAIAEETAVQEFRYKLGDLEVTPWQEPQANPQAHSSAMETGAAGPRPDQGDEEE